MAGPTRKTMRGFFQMRRRANVFPFIYFSTEDFHYAIVTIHPYHVLCLYHLSGKAGINHNG